jgi:hypothetical protein
MGGRHGTIIPPSFSAVEWMNTSSGLTEQDAEGGDKQSENETELSQPETARPARGNHVVWFHCGEGASYCRVA